MSFLTRKDWSSHVDAYHVDLLMPISEMSDSCWLIQVNLSTIVDKHLFTDNNSGGGLAGSVKCPCVSSMKIRDQPDGTLFLLL